MPGFLLSACNDANIPGFLLSACILVTSTAAAALEHCGVAAAGATAAVRRIARSTLTYNTKFRNARRKLYSMLDEHPHDSG